MSQLNEDIKLALSSLPEALKSLSKSRKTELKRVRNPEEFKTLGGFYELCSAHKVLQNNLWQMRNVTFFLPWIEHTVGISLGCSLFRAEINEMRIYQVIRSTYSNDLIYLYRLMRTAISKGKTKKLSIDWDRTSLTLFYWGENSKREILRDYFREEFFTENKPEEKEIISNDEDN